MKDVYLAGPFFNEDQKQKLKQVDRGLQLNMSVGTIFRPSSWIYDEEFGSLEWKHKVYETDILGIKNSDMVVAISNFLDENNEIILDPGTAVEIGIARGMQKPVVLVYIADNDNFDKILNVMVDLSTDAHILGNEDNIFKLLRDFNFDEFKVDRFNWKTT